MLLSISEGARRDLHEMYLHGRQVFGEQASRNYLGSMLSAINRLLDWPFVGHIREEVRPAVRLWPHNAHNIFYDVAEPEIRIVRILHHSADWKNQL